MMDELKTTVSHSEIESYLQCERKHFYEYGMNLTSIYPNEAFARGSFGHAALEVAFNHCLDTGAPLLEGIDKAIDWVGKETTERLDEVGDFSPYILRCLINFKKEGIELFDDLTVLAVEIREAAPMAENVEMSLVIDLVVRDAKGHIGVIDHKFIGKFYYGNQTALMPQLTRYIIALRNMDMPVAWVAYSEFNHATGKYKFEVIPQTEAKIARVKHEYEVAANRILAYKYDVLMNKQSGLVEWSEQALRAFNSMICDRCSMRKLCIAELNNEDVQFVLDQNYRVRETNGSGTSEPTDSVVGSSGDETPEGS